MAVRFFFNPRLVLAALACVIWNNKSGFAVITSKIAAEIYWPEFLAGIKFGGLASTGVKGIIPRQLGLLPYSGKISHGAQFRGYFSNCEN